MDAYRSAGVDYDALDAAKREALAAALSTSGLLAARGARAIDESRGEPAFVLTLGDTTLAMVLECLGTKSIIAREFEESGGSGHYADIAYDTVAAVVNDLCCVGALPLVVNAYFATGNSEWYGQGDRLSSLVEGWRRGCFDAGATWGGGESPTLKSLISDNDIELAGSGIGHVPNESGPILGDRLAAGDEIIFLASSGLHANGASIARRVAHDMADGFHTRLPSGSLLGDAILTPSRIYAPLIADLLGRGIVPTYATHITGHGWRKLMRANRDFVYRIGTLPKVPEVLSFLAQRSGMDERESYATFNMGAGFALFCRPEDSERIVERAKACGLQPLRGGELDRGPRSVRLEPLDITFTSDDLSLR
ncbi:MAG TPA: AIR synthase related protein [Actinomycetota bacterium]|jgi:phosphoribosylformylglycinamidine cyclo-ligase|nr:AIR synthase related protein [Actinomycetota bacterium]